MNAGRWLLQLLIAAACFAAAVAGQFGVGDPYWRKTWPALVFCGLSNLLLGWENWRLSVKYRRGKAEEQPLFRDLFGGEDGRE